jgi:hypothetical protein
MCTFDDTIHVEQGDTCGQCMCETTHMEEQSEHDLQHLLDRAEEYCLQQLRLLDGLHPDQPPTWGNGSPSQGAVNREQQEQEHVIETGAIMTLLEIENDGPTGTTGSTGTTGTDPPSLPPASSSPHDVPNSICVPPRP